MTKTIYNLNTNSIENQNVGLFFDKHLFIPEAPDDCFDICVKIARIIFNEKIKKTEKYNKYCSVLRKVCTDNEAALFYLNYVG